MSNKTKARLFVATAIVILLSLIPLVAFASTSGPVAHDGGGWDPCDWFPDWPGCQPPPPPDDTCYGPCPEYTFTASRYLYADDFKEYSEWGPWSAWSTTNKCSSSDENAGLCEDESKTVDDYGYVCPSGWTLYDVSHCKKYYSNSWHYQDASRQKIGDHKEYRRHYRTVLNEHACPAGYEYYPQQNHKDCRKLETFSVTFKYNKEVGDERYCHRPTGQSLGVPSWAMSDFNAQFEELEEAPSGDQYCPYTPCDETITLDKVYGPAVDVGSPVWGPWLDNGDGTWTRIGTQTTTTHWTQDIVDKYDEKHLCGQNEGDDQGSRDLKETRTGDQTLSFVNDPPDCEGWIIYRLTYVNGELVLTEQIASGTWGDVYTDESFTFHDEVTGLEIEVVEPEGCTRGPDEYSVLLNDCRGATVAILDQDDNPLASASTAWTDLYGPEAFDGVLTYEDGNGQQQEVSFHVAKSLDCIDCKVTEIERYPQAGFIAFSQPAGYWGKRVSGFSFCPVIHKVGETPSPERVAEICSLCPEQFPGGYLYDIRGGKGKMFADERVVEIITTCYNAETDTYSTNHHFYWADYLWDEYFKAGFEDDGTRTCSRVNGCIQEIHAEMQQAGFGQ